MTENKRKLTLRLRRTVRVSRQFDVINLGDGREKQTCRECKKSIVINHLAKGVDPGIVNKLIDYRAKGAITGVCKTCSKERARERYPLSEDR